MSWCGLPKLAYLRKSGRTNRVARITIQSGICTLTRPL